MVVNTLVRFNVNIMAMTIINVEVDLEVSAVHHAGDSEELHAGSERQAASDSSGQTKLLGPLFGENI